MSKYIVYLIEDCEEHAEKTLAALNRIKTDYSDKEYTFTFKKLEGTVSGEYEDEPYTFYDSSVFEKIEQQIKEAKDKGNYIGLLLDTMLTRDDIISTSLSYYPKYSISRDIFERFSDRIPIYIITSTSAFGYQSEITMGRNLSEQYIKYQKLANYPRTPISKELKQMFSFYRNFYKNAGSGKRTKERTDERQMELV